MKQFRRAAPQANGGYSYSTVGLWTVTFRMVNSLWDARDMKWVKGVQTQLTLADLSWWRFCFSGWDSAGPFSACLPPPVTLAPSSAHSCCRLLTLRVRWNALRLAINLQVSFSTEVDDFLVSSFWPDFLTNHKAVWFYFRNCMNSLGAAYSWFLISLPSEYMNYLFLPRLLLEFSFEVLWLFTRRI